MNKNFQSSPFPPPARRGLLILLLATLATGPLSYRLHAQTAKPAAQPAPPPIPGALAAGKSPVSLFRELLGMTPAEREKALASRGEAQRRSIAAKIGEYEAMPVEDRELRLRTTELHWYLIPLMRLPAAERQSTLASVPPETRKLIEERLQKWDLLPPDLQKEVWDNQPALHYIVRRQQSPSAEQDAVLTTFTGTQRHDLLQKVEQWKSLPAERRKQMYASFQQFFELSPAEKSKAMDALNAQQRERLEKTLHAFDKLPPEQRKACLDSFQKFAGMNRTEKENFLSNAERWQAMSPREKQAWRLAAHSAPPAPPGLDATDDPSLTKATPPPGASKPAPPLPGEQKPEATQR